jgi:hypothetical protein
MFGRKEKAAVAALPPQHRALAVDHALAVAQTPEQWSALFASLARNDQLVPRHPLPPRVPDVLVRLVRVLSQDVDPGGTIGVTADLRGPDAPGKVHPGRQLQPVRPVTRIDEQISWDPWLVLSAALRNGGQLDLTVVDVGRIHTIRKRSSSGKTKLRSKRKDVQRIAVTLKTAKGAVIAPPPPSPATGWLRVSAQAKGERSVVVAKGKYPIPASAPAGWQLNTIMLSLAEVFRWVPAPTDASGDGDGAGATGSAGAVGPGGAA